MNKINNIGSIANNYSKQNKNKVAKENTDKATSNNTEATITHTKPSLKAENVEDVATQVLEHAKNSASKALEASTSNLDEARIKALLED